MLFFPDGLGRDLIRLQESYFWPEDPGKIRTSWKHRGPFRSPPAPDYRPRFGDGEKGNSVPLTGLPEIEGGHLGVSLRCSPAGAGAQQEQEEQWQPQQLQDAPARGRQAPDSQPHAVRSRSSLRSRSTLAGDGPSFSTRREGKALSAAIVRSRWKAAKEQLTLGNNSIRGGRGRHRRRRWRGCWRGCCRRCHGAQTGRS